MRFLTIVGVVIGVAWLAMLALVTWVEPYPRDISQIVPAAKLNK
jgi:hypothetical protein